MQVVFLTRRTDHQINSPLITVLTPEQYNIWNHLLINGKCKIKEPWSYSDWYVLGYDIETKGEPLNGKVLLSAFCDDGENVLVIDNTSVDNHEVFDSQILKKCFFIAHNADFEARWGVATRFLPERFGCTMVNGKRLLSGQEGFRNDIISIINRYLGYQEIPIWMEKDIRNTFATLEFFTEEHILYNAADTIRLKQLYFEQLRQAAEINQLFLHGCINSRLIIPIAQAEITGIRHDTDKWLGIAKERKEKADKICQELDQVVLEQYKLNPGTINPEIRKKEESQKKKLEKADVRRLKLQTQLTSLEEKGKTHLKSYQKQKEQLEKLNVDVGAVLLDKTTDIVHLINWASAKQVLEVLRQIGCPLPEARKQGKITQGVGKEHRQNWFVNNPNSSYLTFMKKYDSYKKLIHNVNSFGEGWVNKFVRGGRVYTIYRTSDTSTGRFSSGDKKAGFANLQQIPSGAEYRSCFLADEGYDLVTNDYKACEGILMASLAKDLTVKAILDLPDMHSFFGTKCYRNIYNYRFQITGEDKWKQLSETYVMDKSSEVKEKERHKFKNSAGLFPVAYGIHASKVAATAQLSIEEGQICIDTIKAEVPKVITFLDEQSLFATTNGYIIHNTRTNSRRWFTSILDSIQYGYKVSKANLLEVESASRNSAIQGSNADVVKEAICWIDIWKKVFKKDCTFLIQAHDELVYSVPKMQSLEYSNIIPTIMRRAAKNYLMEEISMDCSTKFGSYWEK